MRVVSHIIGAVEDCEIGVSAIIIDIPVDVCRTASHVSSGQITNYWIVEVCLLYTSDAADE